MRYPGEVGIAQVPVGAGAFLALGKCTLRHSVWNHRTGLRVLAVLKGLLSVRRFGNVLMMRKEVGGACAIETYQNRVVVYM